jgi:hypothetical protein
MSFSLSFESDREQIPVNISTLYINCLIDISWCLEYIGSNIEEIIVLNRSNDNTRYDTLDFRRFHKLKKLILGDVMVKHLQCNEATEKIQYTTLNEDLFS